ncbi:MAG TPA: hypothetical protein VGL81_17840 [Polyangiaceae bacterium]|jgi:hypothetical protein
MTDSHGTPPEAEPQTPMWLPALGAALFVAVALWWAVSPSAPPVTGDETTPAASVSAVAPVAAAPAPRPPQGAQAAQAAMATASAHAGPPGSLHLNPAIEDRLRKMHEGVAPGAPPRHP